MAFTQQARSRLQKFVKTARKILENDFRGQLQSIYGMDPATGAIADLQRLHHLNTTKFETASDLREIYAHYRAQASTLGDADSAATLRRILREQTQTALHRLCAIRMAEERGVLQSALSKGMHSDGFTNYKMVVGSSLGSSFDAYEKFLKSTFDELAQDLPQLFDRTLPYGLLFPREKPLMDLLDEINAGDLSASGNEKSFWAEDETIGWIFQYFNSEEDFATMRGQKNKNPKNSYELAVRNQFFTPRYVVEFLVDNTLGRRWAEITHGNTKLLSLCHSLIWNESRSDMPGSLRDPRSIRVLDPACGSMHFGLYAYNLLEVIYEECWNWLAEDPSRRLRSTPEGTLALQHTYNCKADFLRDVPRLILTYNLFGVDIDVRATQIASLALWLRAQRALNQQGLPSNQRPQLGAGHVVAAVAPPPEQDLAKKIKLQFSKRACAGFQALSLNFLRLIPETGILLPLEDSLKSVEDALLQQSEQPSLFGDDVGKQFSLALESSAWENQRDAVQAALGSYIEEAGHSFQEQLFARDAAQCLKLIDLCTSRFDVIVMNPPFGAPADGSRDALGKFYPSTKKEIIGMFILRMLRLLNPHGYVGAISSRTVFFQDSTAKWRKEVLYTNTSMPVFLDLGPNVMDNALVESAAYVIGSGKSGANTVFIDATKTDRTSSISSFLQNDSHQIQKKLQSFESAPDGAVIYFARDDVLAVYADSSLKSVTAKQGLATGDNDRFVRLFWESEPSAKKWLPLAKGGEATPFYGDVPTEINWARNGEEIKQDICFKYPYLKGNYSFVVKNEDAYYRPCLTWTLRANSLSLRVFPQDGIFDHGGSCVFVAQDDPEKLLATLAVLNSRAFQNLMAVRLQWVEGNSRYECGMLSSTPFPAFNTENKEALAQWAKQNFNARRKLDSVNEESRAFVLPEVIQLANEELNRECELTVIEQTQQQIDSKVDELYGLQSQIIAKQEKSRQLPIPDDTEKQNRLLSWAVGVAFGRFDWRLATGERDIPAWGEPFDAYPALAPGRLPTRDSPLIPNQGIFAMDPSHDKDLERAVQTVLETCGLNVNIDIGKWLEREFFKFHLGIYSAAARVAPIYWPIGTTSGSYVLWLYYPKLSSSMLYAVLNDCIDPKLELEKRNLAELHQQAQNGAVRRQLERKATFISELTVLREKLQQLADTYQVHFDDGVAINAVRFMPLIQSKEWLKKLEKTKSDLEGGKLDWSETAADLYPERVKEACKKNPSIRLAHVSRNWFPEDQTNDEQKRAEGLIHENC